MRQAAVSSRTRSRRRVSESVYSACVMHHQCYAPVSSSNPCGRRFSSMPGSVSYPSQTSGPSSLIKEHLAGGASRLAALLLPQILPVFSVVAPCHPGAALRDLVLVQRRRATSCFSLGKKTNSTLHHVARGTRVARRPARSIDQRAADAAT